MSRHAFVEAYELRAIAEKALCAFLDRERADAAAVMIAKAKTARGRFRRRKDFAEMGEGTVDERFVSARRVVVAAFGADVADDLFKAYDDRAGIAYRLWGELRKSINDNLDALADSADVAPGDPLCVDTVWTSSYSTQGFGASRYAEGAAENIAIAYRMLGVPVEVRRVVLRSSLETWEVWANVEGMVDREIVQRRKYALRDWLKSCLKRGLNPRVYHPMLPHGTEARLGLDYYGNDVPATAVAS